MQADRTLPRAPEINAFEKLAAFGDLSFNRPTFLSASSLYNSPLSDLGVRGCKIM